MKKTPPIAEDALRDAMLGMVYSSNATKAFEALSSSIETAKACAEREQVNSKLLGSKEVQEAVDRTLYEAEQARRAKEEDQIAAYNRALRQAIAQSGRNAERVQGNDIAQAQKAAASRGVTTPYDYKAMQRQQNYESNAGLSAEYIDRLMKGDWNEPAGLPRPKAAPKPKPKPQPIDFCKTPKRKFNFDE